MELSVVFPCGGGVGRGGRGAIFKMCAPFHQSMKLLFILSISIFGFVLFLRAHTRRSHVKENDTKSFKFIYSILHCGYLFLYLDGKESVFI